MPHLCEINFKLIEARDFNFEIGYFHDSTSVWKQELGIYSLTDNQIFQTILKIRYLDIYDE